MLKITGYIINALSAMIALEYIDHAFRKKYKGIRRILLWLLGCGLYFLVVTLLNRITDFEDLAGLMYGAVLFFYSILALEGNKTDFLLLSLMWVIIALISAYIMFGFLGITTGEGIGELLKKSGTIRTYSALAAGALKFSLGRVVLATYKKKGKMAVKMEEGIVAGTFLILFILILGMFRLETEDLSQTGRYYLSLQLLGGMFGMAVFLNIFYRLLDRYRRRCLEQEYLEEERRLQKEQIHDLYRVGREANHMRHDMKVKMDIIYGLLEKGNYEEAKMCVRKLGAEWYGYPELPGDTGNEGLNAALMKAAQKCKEKNVKFHYVVMGRPEEISSMDMGNLIDNLLDNGIEACEGLNGDGRVEIVIRKENGIVEIETENTIKESILKTNPEMKSTKNEKSRHGFGMETIRRIVEVYKGEYYCLEEQEDRFLWFIQSICLRIPAGEKE